MEGNGRPVGGPVQRVEIGVVAEITGSDPSVEDVVEDIVEDVIVEDIVVEDIVVEDIIVEVVEGSVDESVDETPEPSRAVTAAAELMVQATRLGFGLAELAGVTVRAIVERFGATVATGVPPAAPVPRPPGVLPDTVVGLVLSAERRLLDAAERIDARLAPVVSFVATRTPVRYSVDLVRSWVTGYAERGAADQAENRLAISALVGALIPEVVGAVLEDVDVDGVVASVDLDRVLDRVDVARILDRIDLDAVVRRVDLGAVVESIDIQAIVDRLDLDALAARIDMNAVVNRLDLPTITEQVMEEVDIGEIIRESTGTIGTGAVDTLRYGGMSMDRFVGRVVDRVLFRREGRALTPPGATEEEPALVPVAPTEGDSTGP